MMVLIRDELTQRENEVVKLHVSDCMTRKQIAAILGITWKCVDRHLEHVYRKLGISNMQELCKLYWTGSV